MLPFLSRCPNTGFQVQGFVGEVPADDGVCQSVSCLLCQQVHPVNPATSKVLGEDNK